MGGVGSCCSSPLKYRSVRSLSPQSRREWWAEAWPVEGRREARTHTHTHTHRLHIYTQTNIYRLNTHIHTCRLHAHTHRHTRYFDAKKCTANSNNLTSNILNDRFRAAPVTVFDLICVTQKVAHPPVSSVSCFFPSPLNYGSSPRALKDPFPLAFDLFPVHVMPLLPWVLGWSRRLVY